MKKAIFLLQFLWSSGFNLVYRILPSFLSTYIPSALQIGLVHTSYSTSRLLNMPCGALADKTGRRKVLFMAFFLLPLIAVSFTISSSLLHFILMFFILGLLANFYYSSINSLATLFFKRKVQSLFSMEAMYQLGFAIGPIAGGFLTLQYGIEAAFYTWAGLGIAGMLLSTLLFKQRGTGQERPQKMKFWAGLKEQKLAFLIFLVAGSFLTGFLDAVAGLGIPLYATGIGFDIFEVGLILGVSALLSVFGLYFFGRFLEGLPKGSSLVLLLLLMVLPFVLLTVARDMVSLALIAAIFTIGRAGSLNISRAFIASSTSTGNRAKGMATIDTVFYIGRFGGPLFAGALIDMVSIQFAFWSASAVGFAVMAFVLAASRMKAFKMPQGV
jgi:MFS family permease